MRQYSIKKLCLILAMSSSLLPLGCNTGFDYSALKLSENDLIDYGAMAKEDGGIAPGTAIYGVLRSGVGSNAEQQSRGELGQITQTLNAMSAIKDKSRDVDPFVESIKSDLSQTINGKVREAPATVSGAEGLAREMESYVKKGSVFRSKIESLEKSMQKHSGASEFKTQSERLIGSFERLYQMGIVFAMAKSQNEASEQTGLMQMALERLQQKTLGEAIFTDAGPTLIALRSSLGKLSNLRDMVVMMTTSHLVGASLTSAVVDAGASLVNLKTACGAAALSDLKYKPEIDSLLADAEKAKNELSTIAATFNGYEKNLKENSDTSLEALIKRGFSGEVGVSVSAVKLSRETELVRFMRQLSKNKIVVLKKDEAASEFIKALAVAVEKNTAEFYGLKLHNVYGVNTDNLLKSKKLFGMGDNDFQGHVENMAKQANNEKSEEDTQPVVFVLFIDDLGEDIDVGPIAENLSLGNSRVVVVTSTPSKFKKTSAFVSSGLDLMSGFFVAKATVEAIDPKINASLVVEPLIKLYYGLKSRPDQMNLVSLPEAAKEMLLRLRDNASPSSAEIDEAAKDTLASSKDKIPVELAGPSQVLASTLSAVESQIDGNRFYFLEKAKSTGANLEEIAQLRKTREDNKRLQEIIDESNERKTKTQDLKNIYRGYKRKLKSAPPEPDLSQLVSRYRQDIDKAREKAMYTLQSMSALLRHELCVFNNQSEIPTATYKGFDAGHVEFMERVGKQKFDPALIKDPMQFFTMRADGSVVPPPVPTAAQRAAIGLNCYLTGRGRGGLDDGQSTLDFKSQIVMTEVNNVSQDAKDLADHMRHASLTQFAQKHLDLRERLEEDTFGGPWRGVPAAENNKYWKRNLSPYKSPTPGSLAAAVMPALRYGLHFNVATYLKSYPTDYSNAALHNAQWFGHKDAQLPEHFLGAIYHKVKATRTLARPLPLTKATSFRVRDAAVINGVDYSINNAYGLSLQGPANYLGLNLAGTSGIPPGAPPWIGDFPHADFIKLNSRIWAWFLSRIVGKIPNLTNPTLENELYKPRTVNLVPTNLFSKKEVFIDRVFELTEQFVQDSNRSLITLYALQVLEKYYQMYSALYALKPADYNAFLQQAPPTALSSFFAEVEKILMNQSAIDDIKAGTKAQVDAWRKLFISSDIKYGLADFALAAPAAPALDAVLAKPGNSKWGFLQATAAEIDVLREKIKKQITLINP